MRTSVADASASHPVPERCDCAASVHAGLGECVLVKFCTAKRGGSIAVDTSGRGSRGLMSIDSRRGGTGVDCLAAWRRVCELRVDIGDPGQNDRAELIDVRRRRVLLVAVRLRRRQHGLHIGRLRRGLGGALGQAGLESPHAVTLDYDAF